tara:strand:+ start:424 stop:657 length:234 start_codon:yes stop_codon:yes gene_type:complete
MKDTQHLWNGKACKWCKNRFTDGDRTRQDKFGNWMHGMCWMVMMEEYRMKAMLRHIKAGTGGYRQEESSPDIYGGTS